MSTEWVLVGVLVVGVVLVVAYSAGLWCRTQGVPAGHHLDGAENAARAGGSCPCRRCGRRFKLVEHELMGPTWVEVLW